MNPVVLLDEVDKIGSDVRGDPASALLEVLDPAQNHTFKDHFLDVELDLSQVLFVATANLVDTIPAALLDRMEVIRLEGYGDEEKLAIARRHLVARQLARAGLRDDEVEVTDAALRTVVAGYTREAGVRQLEREIGRMFRKVARRVATHEPARAVRVDTGDVPAWLGRPRFVADDVEHGDVPGVATGLAVTAAGGDVLVVEATSMPGGDGLTVTGQLGDVMAESAEIALSYVRAHAAQLGVAASAFHSRRFHLHVPAGAVPKDGPSAGVTMVTALVSLLREEPVRAGVAMTGEVTLRGLVLPVGGVRQKVMAAHRAGLTDIVVPRGNAPELDDVAESVREAVRIHLVDDVTDVLAVALAGAGAPPVAARGRDGGAAPGIAGVAA